MANHDVEAKNMMIKKMEDLLITPIFDIFHVQRAQLAEKTESQNSLLFHFKSSMSRIRTWNISTIKNFTENLIERFPVLGSEFDSTFEELQSITCSVLNSTSTVNNYHPVLEPNHTYIHEFISSCADAFISYPEWFAMDSDSTEFQTCKNNAKIRMKQTNIVENTVMTFVKTSRKEDDTVEENTSKYMSEDDMDGSESDRSDESVSSSLSSESSVKVTKKINIKSGSVTEEIPDMSTFEDNVEVSQVVAPPVIDTFVESNDDVQVDVPEEDGETGYTSEGGDTVLDTSGDEFDDDLSDASLLSDDEGDEMDDGVSDSEIETSDDESEHESDMEFIDDDSDNSDDDMSDEEEEFSSGSEGSSSEDDSDMSDLESGSDDGSDFDSESDDDSSVSSVGTFDSESDSDISSVGTFDSESDSDSDISLQSWESISDGSEGSYEDSDDESEDDSDMEL